MRWICILVASVAMAQTGTVPAKPTPAAATPATPAPDRSATAAPTAPALPAKPAGTAAELMRASLDKQRASIRRQAQATGAELIPWTPSPFFDGPAPACDPVADTIVTPLIDSAAQANSLPAPLVRAVIEAESAYRPCAVSNKGAEGLMQIMPDTAAALNVSDVFDPKQNIAAGAKYLKQLLDRYKGDSKLALAAYNAGPAAVDAANGVPDIPETRNYVDAIMKKVK